MYKIKIKEEIIKFLENEPNSQREISRILKVKFNIEIHRKILHDYLQRLMKNKEIASIKKTREIKSFVRYNWKKKWGEKAQLYYFYTPLSSKLYKKLKRRYSEEGKNDQAINEIVDLYRIIEVMSIYQKSEFTNKKLIKRLLKAKKEDYSNLKINQKIKKAKRDINWFYRTKKDRIIKQLKNASLVNIQGEEYFLFNGKLYELEKLEKFYNLLKMTPYMQWLSSIDKNLKDITNPMMDKMGMLFTRVFINQNV